MENRHRADARSYDSVEVKQVIGDIPTKALLKELERRGLAATPTKLLVEELNTRAMLGGLGVQTIEVKPCVHYYLRVDEPDDDDRDCQQYSDMGPATILIITD
jgi:hypothetical protein